MKDGYALDALETIFQIEINSWEMDIFLGGSISISGICGWQDGSRQLKESLSLILDDHSFFFTSLCSHLFTTIRIRSLPSEFS